MACSYLVSFLKVEQKLVEKMVISYIFIIAEKVIDSCYWKLLKQVIELGTLGLLPLQL